MWGGEEGKGREGRQGNNREKGRREGSGHSQTFYKSSPNPRGAKFQYPGKHASLMRAHMDIFAVAEETLGAWHTFCVWRKTRFGLIRAVVKGQSFWFNTSPDANQLVEIQSDSPILLPWLFMLLEAQMSLLSAVYYIYADLSLVS